MPAANYAQIAERCEKRIFNDSTISEQNKIYLRRFLTVYDVSHARLEIFFSNIRHLLRMAPDIKIALNDQDTIPLGMRRLRDRYSPATYTTILKVSLRFSRWLNNGDLPVGLRDIKTPPRNKMLRQLQPDDMITWEDGLKLISMTDSIQFRAIVMTQLDAGFRPSEFTDLNFGDVKTQENLVIVNVKSGKTGTRTVILHRAAPYLQQWLKNHPTKTPSDPLWLREGFGRISNPGYRGITQRYPYPAIIARLKKMGAELEFSKPLDFYNLRHSSCVLDKLDNLPVDLAAMRHGHSVEHFTRTYGRLSTKDLTARFSRHYGISAESTQRVENWKCSICGNLNPSHESHCFSCTQTRTNSDNKAESHHQTRNRLVRETSLRLQQQQARETEKERMQDKLDQFESAVLELARREIERHRSIGQSADDSPGLEQSLKTLVAPGSQN